MFIFKIMVARYIIYNGYLLSLAKELKKQYPLKMRLIADNSGYKFLFHIVFFIISVL